MDRVGDSTAMRKASLDSLQIKVSPYQILKHLPLAIARYDYHMSHRFLQQGQSKSLTIIALHGSGMITSPRNAQWLGRANVFSTLPYLMNVQCTNGSSFLLEIQGTVHLANPYIGY